MEECPIKFQISATKEGVRAPQCEIVLNLQYSTPVFIIDESEVRPILCPLPTKRASAVLSLADHHLNLTNCA